MTALTQINRGWGFPAPAGHLRPAQHLVALPEGVTDARGDVVGQLLHRRVAALGGGDPEQHQPAIKQVLVQLDGHVLGHRRALKRRVPRSIADQKSTSCARCSGQSWTCAWNTGPTALPRARAHRSRGPGGSLPARCTARARRRAGQVAVLRSSGYPKRAECAAAAGTAVDPDQCRRSPLHLGCHDCRKHALRMLRRPRSIRAALIPIRDSMNRPSPSRRQQLIQHWVPSSGPASSLPAWQRGVLRLRRPAAVAGDQLPGHGDQP